MNRNDFALEWMPPEATLEDDDGGSGDVQAASIGETVREVVAAHLELPPSAIRTEQRLEEDLGITSLGLVLMALDLEDVLDVRLPYDRLGEVKTVGALCTLAREMSVPWPVERPTWPDHR